MMHLLAGVLRLEGSRKNTKMLSEANRVVTSWAVKSETPMPNAVPCTQKARNTLHNE